MKVLKFKCELLSDIILNQHSATEGASRTLDFIPGGNFLGIVASKLYAETSEDSEAHSLDMLDLFHSGKVRFGDAHLSDGERRGLKIPAAFFYPKLKSLQQVCYVHHAIPNPTAQELRQLQLKQCRSGFYVFSETSAHHIEAETSCAIKSAYDKNKRCAMDEQLYVYESLRKGVNLMFEVEIDDDSRMNTSENVRRIIDALCGNKRVGRSRTAQFGLVRITQVDEYQDVISNSEGSQIIVKGQPVHCVTVYADARLIFLDEYGQPTYQPTAAQLGLPADAEILWEKSQIRTFQYAPWNYKRQCFDTDRCGLEKGSVIVVRCDHAPSESCYVGAYRNEGFGKVIYNPDFLKATEEGITLIDFPKQSKTEQMADREQQAEQLLHADNTLLKYLGKQMADENMEFKICKEVNRWVIDEKRLGTFKDSTFASQWGTIRKLAMLYCDEDDLLYHLYGETRGKYVGTDKKKASDAGYLTHGVASTKWKERNRLGKLKDFCELFNGHLQRALINLASEMAKQCR